MTLTEFHRDGLVFDVADQGEPVEGTVVLLHGFPQRSDSWGQVIPPLISAGYRVLAPDQRGYSPRARPGGIRPYALPELIADIVALVGAAGDGPVHLVGHDWGAAVAWGFAAAHPELLHSVTGVSVPPTGAFLQALRSPRQAIASWYFASFQIPGLADRVVDPGSRVGHRLLVHWLSAKAGQQRSLAERDVSALGNRAGLTAALAWYRAARFALGEAASRIATPALFVWSTGDVAITPVAAKLAGRYVSGPYRSVTLAGVSHWIPDEAPEALATVMLEHFAEHARGSYTDQGSSTAPS